MSLSIEADVPLLREAEDGVVYIGDTRVPLERVIGAFLTGMTPEQIAQDFDVLAIEDVYAVVAYFLRHRAEVDAYLNAAAADANAVRQQVEQVHDSSGIRARLLARRASAGVR